jgi:hypothetical protein
LFRFQGPRYPPRFVSRSFRSRSRKVGGNLPGQVNCSTDDPSVGLLSRGRERDLSGSQAIHPVPLPRSKTPAEPTIPRHLAVSSVLPPLLRQRRLQHENHIGATARLWHLLLTLHEWCCHHPCKARFRLAGWPLPGGCRTLWIAKKGFRFRSHPPFLDFPDATKIGSSTSIVAVMHTRSRKVEMPSGLSLPLAFGMNTLLMGSGR